MIVGTGGMGFESSETGMPIDAVSQQIQSAIEDQWGALSGVATPVLASLTNAQKSNTKQLNSVASQLAANLDSHVEANDVALNGVVGAVQDYLQSATEGNAGALNIIESGPSTQGSTQSGDMGTSGTAYPIGSREPIQGDTPSYPPGYTPRHGGGKYIPPVPPGKGEGPGPAPPGGGPGKQPINPTGGTTPQPVPVGVPIFYYQYPVGGGQSIIGTGPVGGQGPPLKITQGGPIPIGPGRLPVFPNPIQPVNPNPQPVNPVQPPGLIQGGPLPGGGNIQGGPQPGGGGIQPGPLPGQGNVQGLPLPGGGNIQGGPQPGGGNIQPGPLPGGGNIQGGPQPGPGGGGRGRMVQRCYYVPYCYPCGSGSGNTGVTIQGGGPIGLGQTGITNIGITNITPVGTPVVGPGQPPPVFPPTQGGGTTIINNPPPSFPGGGITNIGGGVTTINNPQPTPILIATPGQGPGPGPTGGTTIVVQPPTLPGMPGGGTTINQGGSTTNSGGPTVINVSAPSCPAPTITVNAPPCPVAPTCPPAGTVNNISNVTNNAGAVTNNVTNRYPTDTGSNQREPIGVSPLNPTGSTQYIERDPWHDITEWMFDTHIDESWKGKVVMYYGDDYAAIGTRGSIAADWAAIMDKPLG